VITTDNSDWATNCPEYKVTAVQVDLLTQPTSTLAEREPVIAGGGR
jgi:formate dehydrogenase major subunit